MARTLKSFVYVEGVGYGPGDDVPADVAKRIGDHAWTEDEVTPQRRESDGFDRGVQEQYIPVGGVQPEGGAGDGERAGTQRQTGDEPVAPPRTGKGSGVDAWKAHAEKLGLTVPDGADRDDVMAAVDAHQLAKRDAQK